MSHEDLLAELHRLAHQLAATFERVGPIESDARANRLRVAAALSRTLADEVAELRGAVASAQ